MLVCRCIVGRKLARRAKYLVSAEPAQGGSSSFALKLALRFTGRGNSNQRGRACRVSSHIPCRCLLVGQTVNACSALDEVSGEWKLQVWNFRGRYDFAGYSLTLLCLERPRFPDNYERVVK